MVSSMAHRPASASAWLSRTACAVGARGHCWPDSRPVLLGRPRRCPSLPAPPSRHRRTVSPWPRGPTIATVPWPQQRYDFAALAQFADGSRGHGRGHRLRGIADAPQLAGAVVPGADLLAPGGDGREDCSAHGTAVASIIAARPTPATGLRGLAPGATDPAGTGQRTHRRHGADPGIATGRRRRRPTSTAGIRAAVAHRPEAGGHQPVHLHRTDNAGAARRRRPRPSPPTSSWSPPSATTTTTATRRPTRRAYPGVVGVGAIGPDSTRVAVVPGRLLCGHRRARVAGRRRAARRRPAGYEGTSFAAPFVSATAALIRARWPHLDQADVVRRLLATADPAPGGRPSPEYGYGVLNPMRALTAVVTGSATPAARRPHPHCRRPRRPPPATRRRPWTAHRGRRSSSGRWSPRHRGAPAGRHRRWRPVAGASSRPRRRYRRCAPAPATKPIGLVGARVSPTSANSLPRR